jgi:hypothetical protein
MFDAFPAGTFTKLGIDRPFGPFEVGARYEVVRAFTDFDGDTHPPGETWAFLGHNFVPYEDGLSLFVTLDGEREWNMRMCWRPEDQGPVINAFADYVRRV